jgi:hypothetical protein
MSLHHEQEMNTVMKRFYILLILAVLFGLSLAAVSAGVIPDADIEIHGASGKCSEIDVTYHPYGAFAETFDISWTLFQGKTVVTSGLFNSPQNTNDDDANVTLTLKTNLAAGTYIIAFDGEGTGSDDTLSFTVPACTDTSSSEPVELPPCELSDNRLDEGCSSFVTTYAQVREDGCYISIYSPYGRADGKTVLLLQGTPAEIAAAQAAGGNAVIDHVDVVNLTEVTLYWLSATNEFQINAGPNAEGKVYVLNFTGCEASNVYTTNSYQEAD